LARHKFCMLSMYTYVIFSKKSYFHDSVPLIMHWTIGVTVYSLSNLNPSPFVQ